MNKLLCIVGPTATGKTALALKLAQEFNSDLVSADSRQVYQGMDIGTGKDLPVNVKTQMSNVKSWKKQVKYYSIGDINIWGLDLVKPDESFAVSEYVRYTIPVIKYIWHQGKLPIIVGGTGLYVRALTKYLPEIFIPRDNNLRKEINILTPSELQQILIGLNRQKFASMNQSDQANPRRLVRAIEIAMWQQKYRNDIIFIDKYYEFIANQNVLIIGLTSIFKELNQRIEARVEERIKQGIFTEIKNLLDKGYSWELPAMSGLGYREWREYVENSKVNPSTASGLTQSEVERVKSQKSKLDLLRNSTIKKWKIHEKQYAKRQLTWFRKEKNILWFDITDQNYLNDIRQMVEKWYNK